MSEPFESPRSFGSSVPPATMSAFLPVLILALVMLAWFVFQGTQLRMERDAIRDATTNQEKQVQDSKKLRDALDAVARGTAKLADAGNPNARLIVDELKKHGITLSPDEPPAEGPAPPTKK